MQPLDMGGQGFRKKRPPKIGAHGDQIIQGMAPLAIAQGHGEQDEVGGLGIAEYPAPDGIGKSSIKSRHPHKDGVDPRLFTF